MKIKFLSNLYLSDRFFLAFGGLVALFITSFFVPLLFALAKTVLLVFVALLVVDGILLFHPRVRLSIHRKLPESLSLGDDNSIYLDLVNLSGLQLRLLILDELPPQLQRRDLRILVTVAGAEKRQLSYEIRPLERGEYTYGQVLAFAMTSLGLLRRRFRFNEAASVPVYPSFIQMKRYELMAFSRTSNIQGIKRIRRLGHSYEFEQIKNYVRGDDFRSINWKATSKRNELMVNQFEDEKAQQIYSVIDKSRSMRMPFDGLSLLDHSINTSLVISNIALYKHDKAGLITFSDKLGSSIRAERKKGQLQKIVDALYREQDRKLEANYELLYHSVRNVVKGRSLLFLYTNFESLYSLQRVLPILRKINRQHLLVVVFFENSEIFDFSSKEADDLEGIYYQTIAQKFVSEKKQIVQELRKFRIQSILTRPENLSINTINKYLELKSKGLI
ncbi:MAG: DUF58 domain-containing protein [Salibacteraceae bacterium]